MVSLSRGKVERSLTAKGYKFRDKLRAAKLVLASRSKFIYIGGECWGCRLPSAVSLFRSAHKLDTSCFHLHVSLLHPADLQLRHSSLICSLHALYSCTNSSSKKIISNHSSYLIKIHISSKASLLPSSLSDVVYFLLSSPTPKAHQLLSILENR